ncbi:MAG: GIY-YIG nuclease family protein [Steroidobacteraceae bacterium]
MTFVIAVCLARKPRGNARFDQTRQMTVRSLPINSSDIAASASTKTWWLYLLACTDGRTYTGITLDVQTRFRAHVMGRGAKFTRANPPLKILGVQPFPTKSAALQAEYALKQMKPAEKLAWAKRRPDI